MKICEANLLSGILSLEDILLFKGLGLGKTFEYLSELFRYAVQIYIYINSPQIFERY